jgi:hypothetical protein
MNERYHWLIGLAALTNIFGRWVDRTIFGIPMNVFLQYIAPVPLQTLDDIFRGWPALREPQTAYGPAASRFRLAPLCPSTRSR